MKIISRKYEDLMEIRDFVNKENEKTITYVLQEYEEGRVIDEDYMFDRFVKMIQGLQKDDKTITEVVQECYKRLLIDEQTTTEELQNYEESVK